jgi:hypothetical protein
MTELNTLNNTMSSDKSSIVVLSNSLDTEMNSSINSPTVTASSMTVSGTSHGKQLHQTKIKCIFENSNDHSQPISIQTLTTSKENTSGSSNSFDNDGISVLNTMSHDRETFCSENQLDVLNRRLNEYKRENKDLKEQYEFLTNKVEKLIENQPSPKSKLVESKTLFC